MSAKKDMSVSQTYARMLYVNHPSLSLISRKVNYSDDLIMLCNLNDIINYENKLGKDEIRKRLKENIEFGLISVKRNANNRRWKIRL